MKKPRFLGASTGLGGNDFFDAASGYASTIDVSFFLIKTSNGHYPATFFKPQYNTSNTVRVHHLITTFQ